MFNEEKFQFNIENIKNDLAIEGMDITENDVPDENRKEHEIQVLIPPHRFRKPLLPAFL